MSKPKDDLISRAAAVRALASSNGDYLDALERFERLPTIPAIPVEWLEWRVMNAKYNGIKEAADAFDFVLNCWKEQEAQDDKT